MKIVFINLGGISQRFITDGVSYYRDKLSYYAEVDFIFLKKVKFTSSAEKKRKQYQLISHHMDNSYNVVFDLNGKKYSSLSFSKFIEDLHLKNKKINFIIGGDEGFDMEIFNRADSRVSFSDMTFNHEIFLLILLEQTYRAFTIIKGHPYHK